MSSKPSNEQVEHLILAAEREAQMVSAFARILITTIAVTIFLLAGGIRLPVAPVVLTYLGSYALVSVASAIFSSKRLFNPKLSLLFTAVDGIALALLIGFALRATGAPLNFHGAVPGFVFFFCILILATMRYTIGPTIIAFLSFALTWTVFSMVVGGSQAGATASGDPSFYFGTVQNAARWGFVVIATLLGLLAVVRRRRTLVAAIDAANKTANLSRYLPDRVANVVAEQGMDALTSGRQQQATVLFIDIRGFTGISEKLKPSELSSLLGEFRSVVSAEVENHSGIVDKFIGDAVMAVFGVPSEQDNSARHAIDCALSIMGKIEDWNQTRKAAGQAEIRVTLGAHSGEVFAGAVGSENRMEFTVLGDTVNIAARLQEAAKKTERGFVVSGDVLEQWGGEDSEKANWTAFEESAIRGREQRIIQYQYCG